jgi:hypothetical protein
MAATNFPFDEQKTSPVLKPPFPSGTFYRDSIPGKTVAFLSSAAAPACRDVLLVS